MNTLNIVYLVSSLLIFASIMTSTLSARLGVPLLLFFLGVGMLAGDEGVLGITFAEYGLANFIGQAALACILLDGGLRTSLKSFRVGLKPAVVLASWGVVATVLTLGLFATWLLEIDWRLGLLIAAIVGSTDAAAVFSLLRNGGVKLNDRVQATLELESGMNDPLAILLVTVMIGLNIDPASQTVTSVLITLFTQIVVGLIVGIISGFGLSKLLPKVHLAEGMYAILIMSAGLAVFGATNLLGGSGFLAVYLAGVVIGNTKVRATEHVLRVMDSFAWLSQAVLFVVLGLLVTPSALLGLWYYSLALFLFLLFIARPFAVATSLVPFHFRPKEIGFISWVGLRGAVPITLAILPVMSGVEGASLAFNVVFGVVILSLLAQGATIPYMAKTFKVWLPTDDEPKAEHEIWVGDNANITLYEFEVKAGAFAIGRHPQRISSKLNLEGVSVFALVRNTRLAVVDDNTTLKVGDVVWYAMSADVAPRIAKIFNNSVAQYQATSEFYGDWLLSPHVRVGDLPFYRLAMASTAPTFTKMTPVAQAFDNLGWTKLSPQKPPQATPVLAGVDDVLIQTLTESKEMTVAQFMKVHIGVAMVKGDTVKLNDAWSLVVRDMDDNGQLSGVGLKNTVKKD